MGLCVYCGETLPTEDPRPCVDGMRHCDNETRDEIARLQAEVEAVKEARDMMGRLWQSARNDALEEAAQIAHARSTHARVGTKEWSAARGIFAAIQVLKGGAA